VVLETFVAVNSAMFITRAINTKIEQKMREKILSDGLYHVTTEESAEKIMESGHIRPSSNLLSLGRKKCFFFAGAPSYKDLASNCASEARKYEFKAVKVMPNAEELSKFRQRTFNDDSITFVGKCNLPEERARIVDLVLDIDEKGNIYTREKTEEELGDKYIPKDELVQKMNTLGSNNMVGIMGKAYLKEYGTVGKKIWSKIINLKDKITNSKTLKLLEENTNLQEKININEENRMTDMLEKCTYDEREISENYIENKEKVDQQHELIIEDEERLCE